GIAPERASFFLIAPPRGGRSGSFSVRRSPTMTFFDTPSRRPISGVAMPSCQSSATFRQKCSLCCVRLVRGGIQGCASREMQREQRAGAAAGAGGSGVRHAAQDRLTRNFTAPAARGCAAIRPSGSDFTSVEENEFWLLWGAGSTDGSGPIGGGGA